MLDNDGVHIERFDAEPGDRPSIHTHNLSALSVFLTTAKVRVESPGQKPQIMKLQARRIPVALRPDYTQVEKHRLDAIRSGRTSIGSDTRVTSKSNKATETGSHSQVAGSDN